MGRIPKQHKPHGRQSRKSNKRNIRNQHKSASRQSPSKTGRRRSRRKAFSSFAQKVIRPFRSVTLPGFSENESADGADSRLHRTGRILLKLA
ncbi:MAG: sodium:proton antiporter, partial [Scardovia wiggsiae]